MRPQERVAAGEILEVQPNPPCAEGQGPDPCFLLLGAQAHLCWPEEEIQEWEITSSPSQEELLSMWAETFG
ncbi:hypothetical protein P7K49_035345 [Saguinus oedipus]|uniref:Uncharacterized protein n=1 Tax=Saguinus oedipus TaxID=9490 RepID=A0ABQ9TMZ8_SAGOE|nr:hypothetical protein P7K49_035345 [Saguinus oedipus]